MPADAHHQRRHFPAHSRPRQQIRCRNQTYKGRLASSSHFNSPSFTHHSLRVCDQTAAAKPNHHAARSTVACCCHVNVHKRRRNKRERGFSCAKLALFLRQVVCAYQVLVHFAQSLGQCTSALCMLGLGETIEQCFASRSQPCPATLRPSHARASACIEQIRVGPTTSPSLTCLQSIMPGHRATKPATAHALRHPKLANQPSLEQPRAYKPASSALMLRTRTTSPLQKRKVFASSWQWSSASESPSRAAEETAKQVLIHVILCCA